jgi:hypothetical protein
MSRLFLKGLCGPVGGQAGSALRYVGGDDRQPQAERGASRCAPADQKLGDYGVGFFWVDAEVFNRLGYYLGLDFAVLLEFVQGG